MCFVACMRSASVRSIVITRRFCRRRGRESAPLVPVAAVLRPLRRKNGEKVCEQRQEADDAEIDDIDVVGG